MYLRKANGLLGIGGWVSFLAALITACSLQKTHLPDPSLLTKPSALASRGWRPSVRERLETLLSQHAGSHLPVVFDFDNTIVCRDIGESTFETLIAERFLSVDSLAKSIQAALLLPNNPIPPSRRMNPVEYYAYMMNLTRHQTADPSPPLISYAWLVEILAGLSPADIVYATRKSYESGNAEPNQTASDRHVRLRPFFYPEITELLSAFIKTGYDVWIVSASNVWSVRWMVVKALNPKLKAMGAPEGIAPDHVIGISTLLRDRKGRFYKDPLLVQDNPSYAQLDEATLRAFTLTRQLSYPVSGYVGKAAALWQWIGQKPYFVAGDTPSDHAMLEQATYKLWIARLEETNSQKKTVEFINRRDPDSWLIQPTLTGIAPGFLPSLAALKARKVSPDVYEDSLTILSNTPAFGTF